MWERLQQADTAIADAVADDREGRKLDRDLASVEQQAEAANQQVRELAEHVEVELQDVERLEGGWHALLRRVLGDHEERLAAEREEHARAALRLDAARAEATDLATRAARLRERRSELGDTTAALALARERKATVVHEIGGERAQELTRIAEELGEVAADEREVVEAIEAAEVAASWLRDANTLLRTAANWGSWDMFGGGMFVSMAKHGRMRDARQAMHGAAAALRALDTELEDVAADLGSRRSLPTDDLLSMLDVFFDNLISDWMVQGRIRDARHAVGDLMEQVGETATQLARLARGLGDRGEQLADERRALLDQPG